MAWTYKINSVRIVDGACIFSAAIINNSVVQKVVEFTYHVEHLDGKPNLEIQDMIKKQLSDMTSPLIVADRLRPSLKSIEGIENNLF